MRRPTLADLRAGGLWLLAVVAVFLVVFGLARGLSLLFAVDVKTVNAGVIATFTGVAGGIPVALLVGRWLDARQRRQETGARSLRQERVLRTLQTDLVEVLDELVSRDRHQAVFPYLRTDVWHAIADGGQLELIDDPEILNALARAYHRIEATADLERQIWESFHDPMQWTRRISRQTGEDVSGRELQFLTDAVRNQDPHAKAAIDVALERLASFFGEAPPPDRALRP